MPPTLTASPSVTPEATPTRCGRYSCPSTTSTLVGMKMKTASGTRTTRAQFRSVTCKKQGQEHDGTGEPGTNHVAATDAVGQPAPQERPDDAGSQKHDQRLVPLSGGQVPAVDKVKCQEGVQAVEHDRPADRRPAQDAERPPIVVSAQSRSRRLCE